MMPFNYAFPLFMEIKIRKLILLINLGILIHLSKIFPLLAVQKHQSSLVYIENHWLQDAGFLSYPVHRLKQ